MLGSKPKPEHKRVALFQFANYRTRYFILNHLSMYTITWKYEKKIIKQELKVRKEIAAVVPVVENPQNVTDHVVLFFGGQLRKKTKIYKARVQPFFLLTKRLLLWRARTVYKGLYNWPDETIHVG